METGAQAKLQAGRELVQKARSAEEVALLARTEANEKLKRAELEYEDAFARANPPPPAAAVRPNCNRAEQLMYAADSQTSIQGVLP
jgi:hypothetical protein